MNRKTHVLTALLVLAAFMAIACGPKPVDALSATRTSAPTRAVKPGKTPRAKTPKKTPPPRATQAPENTLTLTRAPSLTSTSGAPLPTATPVPALTPTPTPTDFLFNSTHILGRPTDRSITISFVSAAAAFIYYEYGLAPGAYTSQTAPQSAVADAPLETLIDGLRANTRYYYRIRYNGMTGREYTFVTQRAPGSVFTFAIQGDSHPERVRKQFDADLYTRTLLSAAADRPDFYMTIGDDFSVDTLKSVTPETVRALYIKQRQWLGLVGAPLFLVNGNHEQASLANLDGSADNIAVWAQTARNVWYPQPAPDAFYSGDAEPVEHIGLLRDYYAFTWGDALFVVIDPYWHSPQIVDNPFGGERDPSEDRDLWDVTIGDAQYQWFKQALETSNAKYKFVFAHHVLGTGRGGIELAHSFEWGDSANLAARRPGWEKTIHQLMVDNHVSIFFQGHDHIFVRQRLGGVVYQTLPEPANPNYTWENASAYANGQKFPNSGHVRVSVSPDGVTVDYIRSYLEKPDELAFSYTVR